MVVIVTGYTLFVTSQYDVIFTFANKRFGEVCWHNMHIQGCRSSGWLGGAVKQLRAMETCQIQKIATKYACFFSSTTPTSKIITKFLENHFEFSGCPKSCNKFVSSQSWFAMKLPMRLLCKAVVLEVGVEVVQAQPPKFWFAENLRKIPENPGINGAQRCLTSKMTPKVCRKTHEDHFWRSHQRRRQGGGLRLKPPPSWYFSKTLLPSHRISIVFAYVKLVYLST